MRYTLNTNICIYLLKGHPQSTLIRLAQEDFGDVFMSCFTLAEPRRGASSQSGHTQKNGEVALNTLLQDTIALDIDANAAYAFGVLDSSCILNKEKQSH